MGLPPICRVAVVGYDQSGRQLGRFEGVLSTELGPALRHAVVELAAKLRRIVPTREGVEAADVYGRTPESALSPLRRA